MENITIRKITKADLKEAYSLFMKVFNDVGEKWSEITSTKHVNENYNPNYCYVAEKDKVIVGLLLANTETLEEGTWLFVDTFAVLPEYQHQGIGNKFLETVNNIVKNNKLIGFCLNGNPKFESFKWYKKIGMLESGWVELYKQTKN